MIITIDGSAGSGKSTVARKLAKKLGLIHRNSGALFRAIALKAADSGVSLEDEIGISALATDTVFTFKLIFPGASSAVEAPLGSAGENGCETLLLVDGVDISAKLHTAHAGRLASSIAVLPSLRDVLLRVQREEATRHESVVLEGRDAGTVVFPAAEAKFFLDASLEERVKRRFLQLQAAATQDVTAPDVRARGSIESSGSAEVINIHDLEAEMDARDRRDSTRELAPQVPASDAEVIDSTALTAEEVVARICASLERRGLSLTST